MGTTLQDTEKNSILEAVRTNLTGGTAQIKSGSTVLVTLTIGTVVSPVAGVLSIPTNKVAATNATPQTATTVDFLDSASAVRYTLGVETSAVANSGNIVIANDIDNTNEYQFSGVTLTVV